MDRELFEAQWPQIKNLVREKWASLTEEDLRQINGRFDVLVSKLQQKYGYTREQAEEEINRWSPTLGSKTYDARTTAQDGSSLIKWLIAAAIALALWWLWQASQENKPTDNTQPTTTQTAPGTTMTAPATTDTALNDAVNKALQANSTISKDLKNVKVSTSNGVVTITGTIPTITEKDQITSTAQGVNGVKQVVNKLEVK